MATANVTVTINTPAGVSIQDVMDTLCLYWGYTGTLADGITPQTKQQFMQAQLAKFLRQSYIDAKIAQDVATTRTSSGSTASQVNVS